MGITKYDTDLLERIQIQFNPRSVLELGNQFLYTNQKECYGAENGNPVMAKTWFVNKEIVHLSIDINGKADQVHDLTKPIDLPQFDMVTNFGVIEHTDDAYMAFKNVHDLTRLGGVMVHENPKTGNWKDHGNYYFTKQFYMVLAELNAYEIIELDEVAAMSNTIDGWNVMCLMQKVVDQNFITREQFDTLDIRKE